MTTRRHFIVGAAILAALALLGAGGVTCGKIRERRRLTEAICRAAREGNVDEVRSLLNDCSWLTHAGDSHGRTALHAAAISARRTVVELLVANGADVDAPDTEAVRPLHLVVEQPYRLQDSLAIMRLLVKNGADVNAGYGGPEGWGPLQIAVCNNYHEKAYELALLGADPTIKDFEGRTPLRSAARRWPKDKLDKLKQCLAEKGWDSEPQ